MIEKMEDQRESLLPHFYNIENTYKLAEVSTEYKSWGLVYLARR